MDQSQRLFDKQKNGFVFVREIQRKMHGFVYKNSNFWISKNETAAPSEEKVLLRGPDFKNKNVRTYSYYISPCRYRRKKIFCRVGKPIT